MRARSSALTLKIVIPTVLFVLGVLLLVSQLTGLNIVSRVLIALGLLLGGFGARESLKTFDALRHGLTKVLTDRVDQSFLLALATLIFAAGSFLLVVNIVFNPLYETETYSMGPVIVLVAFIALLLPAIYGLCAWTDSWVPKFRRLGKALSICTLLTVILTALLAIAYSTLRPTGFDSRVVLNGAINLALGGSASEFETAYFSIYPNNIFLELLYWKYFSLAHALGVIDPETFLWLSVVLNAVVLAFGVVLTYLVTRTLANRTAALFSLVLAFVFVVISPWLAVPYSDALGLVFPILLVYLYLRADQARTRTAQFWFWGAVGVVAATGYGIKPTVLITFVAICIVALLRVRIWAPLWRRNIAPGVALALCCFGMANVSWTFVQNESGVVSFDMKTNENAVPITHFLMMGAGGTGIFNDEDIAATLAVPAGQDRFDFAAGAYVDRVDAMGVSGYTKFLGKKALLTFGDGTFAQWGEGGLLEFPYVNADPVSVAVQNYFAPDGFNHSTLVNFWQAWWLIVLALLAVPLLLWRRSLFSADTVVLRVAVFGLFVFLMFFETRARYVYLYVPLILVLASVSMHAISARIHELASSYRCHSPAGGSSSTGRRAAARRARRSPAS